MEYRQQFDVIVIGGGHAGTEACLAAARMGCRTLLLTHSVDTLGQMSCNPAIGGIGKSHLVKEIDALGGAMARATDKAGIQFRVLNRRKGPAVRATRVQADRVLYKNAIREMLETQPNLSIFQQPVDDLLIENGRVAGAVTQMGVTFRAPRVVLCARSQPCARVTGGLDKALVRRIVRRHVNEVKYCFQRELSARGVACTVRVEKGVEISAACGQLRGKAEAIELAESPRRERARVK